MGQSRVWLITGASSGFGYALATAAVEAGDTVVGAARRTSGLPDGVDPVELDVTDTAAGKAVVDGVVERHGRLDVLVNAAGRALIGAAEETTDAELRDLMEVHFFGPVALTRAALPHLRAQGSGAIVQFSSLGGRLSFPGVGGYSATKFALEGWSEGLAAEVGPLGVRVLIVEPGAFRTGLHGGGMRMTEPIPAYDDIVGPVRKMQQDFDGTQPGDPAKAAAAILDALAAEEPPLRLALGGDAADAIAASLEANTTELRAWEQVARSTDL
ncbi:SDR family NAD(P)-dependent oxidoreductase [Pseudonocardia adelaidensis]|uniref:SDR family NAD(P)-dependent oxidoreductase n=1 Tax=Pseudonocardia adelaidensis TaxID=648754 RepID=UPI0031EEDB7C